MSAIKEALEKAYKEKKDNYINTLEWKGEKTYDENKNVVQNSKLLIDMDKEELQKCLDHCNKMLYSTNPKHFGRYKVLEEINKQINNCNVELFLRYCENSYMNDPNREDVKRRDLWITLRQLMQKYPEIEDWSKIPMSKVAEYTPSEFKDLTVTDVLNGCIDYLGALDKSHLTLSFILRMGVWLTKAEEKEFSGIPKPERLEMIKSKLKLPASANIKYSDKGLSLQELKSIISLPKKQKYSDMTTDQLKVLRNKILMRLQNTIDSHIFNWKRLINQILLVAKHKNITLDDTYRTSETSN